MEMVEEGSRTERMIVERDRKWRIMCESEV